MKTVTKVKSHFLILAFLLTALLNSLHAAPSTNSSAAVFDDGDRVVFAGDSITHAGWWQVYIADYYLTRFPDRKIVFSNAGIAGDTAGGVLARFDRDVLRDQPNRAVVMLGMNDVGNNWFVAKPTSVQQTAWRNALNRYQQNMIRLLDAFAARNIPVTLVTPSPYDETAKLASASRPGKNEALGEASEFLKTIARERHLALVDFHGPMTRLNAKLQQIDSAATLTGPDRTHPRKPGYFVMAALFLQAQGAPATVASVSIRFPEKRIIRADNCLIADVRADGKSISFDYAPRALPFPVDPELKQAAAWTKFDESLNCEMLQIEGLLGGQYEVFIDGTNVGTFDAAELAKRINLALLDTPMRRAAEHLVELNHQRGGLEMQLRSLEWFGIQLDRFGIPRDDFTAIKARRAELIASPQAKPSMPFFEKQLDNYLKEKANEAAIRKEIADLTSAVESAHRTPQKYHIVVQPVGGLPDVETVIYKKAGDRELKLFVEKPANWKPKDHHPAIVFFHGGGWVQGSPNQFMKESEYFATRGMVCIRVEYRTIPKGDEGPPVVCCEDAKSAIRYVRSHAAELGIDPQHIVAAGASAGGHLAAFTALVPGVDDPADDLTVSCKPEALVLWNPVFNNGPGNYGYERMGDRYIEFSPAHHITSNAPPTSVFFGTQDQYVPRATAKAFQTGMERCGVRCKTIFYEGQKHGFFNEDPWLSKTLAAADQFLTSLGWLDNTAGKTAVSKAEWR